MKVIGLFLTAALLCSCGTKSNFNKIWGADDEGSDSKLVEAKAAYDAKDYSRSEKLTTELLDRNPDNESAAIILGYTLLSLGGIEPIELARELIALSSKKTEETPAAELVQNDASSSSSAATSTLTQLGSLINLSEADFGNLAEKTFDSASNDGNEPSLFAAATNELLVPAKISDDLRNKVAVLGYMNRAIKTICRFVDDGTKNENELRHVDPACAPTAGPRKKRAKSHFLWAFSHLTEALVYQSVILYSGAAGGVSNFQAASDIINTKDYGQDIGSFVSEVLEMKNAVDAVFDTSSSDSMITGTLLNLDIVNRAFGAISGLPAGITEKISQSLNQLNKVSESLGETGVQGNTNALKGQMTEKFAGVIGEKITKVAASNPMLAGKTYKQLEDDDNPAITPEQKTTALGQVASMCKGYDAMAKGLPPEKNKKPSTCTGAPSN